MNSYPIILAHGIARFDFLVQRFSKLLSEFGVGLGLANDGLHYFKGIARHLRDNGFDVYQSSVSFAAGVERRAADLKAEIENALSLRPGTMKVHIIGHSMGGLDARHMIVGYGMAETVASLTTIGTPHNGTSFADWGITRNGDQIIDALGSIVDLGGFADLTTEACRRFNENVQGAEATNSVVYQAYSATQPHAQVFGPLKRPWEIIYDTEGENDGLVPASSQLWQQELPDGKGGVKKITQHSFPVGADHLNEVGWWDVDQIRLADLFNGDLPGSAEQYESCIRDVYLDIARKVQALP